MFFFSIFFLLFLKTENVKHIFIKKSLREMIIYARMIPMFVFRVKKVFNKKNIYF